MFLRRYHRTKDGKTHTYYALVESVRTEAGPRQRVVAYLGELNHDEERRCQRTVVFHNRQGDGRQLRLFPDDEHVDLPDDPNVVRISLKSVGWANPCPFGDVWLGLWLWRHLNLDEIASGRDDGSVTLWETKTFRILERLRVSQGSIQCVAFSADGKMISAGGLDAVLRVCVLDTGDVQRSTDFADPEAHAIRAVVFSPDGRRVAWAGDDTIVRIWDVRKREAVAEYPGMTAFQRAEPDGVQREVSQSGFPKIRLHGIFSARGPSCRALHRRGANSAVRGASKPWPAVW
jgi:WD40 repeat protein